MTTESIDYEDLKKRGFLRQKQDGFFVLRTRMSFGVYHENHIERIREIAKEYGRGIIHATTRQGLEVPFIRFEDIDKVEKELAANGILSGTSGPRLRTTTVCPGNNWCRLGLIDTFSIEKKLEKIGLKCGTDLPHKFKIAISGCPNGCTRPQFSDVGIHGQIDQAAPDKHVGYALYIGGTGGKAPKAGFKLDKIFTEDEVLVIVEKIIDFYRKRGKPKQRLGYLVEDLGGKGNFLKEVMI